MILLILTLIGTVIGLAFIFSTFYYKDESSGTWQIIAIFIFLINAMFLMGQLDGWLLDKCTSFTCTASNYL